MANTKGTRAHTGAGYIRFDPARMRYQGRLTKDRKTYTRYGKTQKEVEEKLRRVSTEVDAGKTPTRLSDTVGKLVTAWLAAIKPPAVRPNTWRGYEEKCRNHILPLWGAVKLAEFKTTRIQTDLAGLVRKGMSVGNARNIRAVLRTCLNWGITGERLTVNPANLVKLPKGEQGDLEVVPFTPEEVDRILVGVQGDRLEAFYAVEIGLGLRPSELLGLTWDNLDLDERTLRVQSTLQRAELQPRAKKARKGPHQEVAYELGAPKTRKSRAVMPIRGFIVTALKQHKTRQTAEQLQTTNWQNTLGLVFTTKEGRPLSEGVVYHHFQKLLDSLGIPRRSLYTLRHTCASLLLNEGGELRDVMEQLRHSQISLTANTYTHLYAERKGANADKMDAVLSKSTRKTA